MRRLVLLVVVLVGAVGCASGPAAGVADAHIANACVLRSGLLKLAPSCAAGEQSIGIRIVPHPASAARASVTHPSVAHAPATHASEARASGTRGPRGPKGKTGPRGRTGERGPVGATGPAGLSTGLPPSVTSTPCPAGEAVTQLQASDAPLCAPFGAGTVTSVTAGTGLAGGGSTGNVTLGIQTPLALSSSATSTTANLATFTNAGHGAAVLGSSTGAGAGVEGLTVTGDGVFGRTTGSGNAVEGLSVGTGAAVAATAQGNGPGVYASAAGIGGGGQLALPGGDGVLGIADGPGGTGFPAGALVGRDGQSNDIPIVAEDTTSTVVGYITNNGDLYRSGNLILRGTVTAGCTASCGLLGDVGP